MASTMDRREAIKTVSLMLGGAFAVSNGLLGAVERAHARAKNPGQQVALPAPFECPDPLRSMPLRAMSPSLPGRSLPTASHLRQSG